MSLADVTGHAMDAAIPAVQFSGILKTEMRYERSLEQLFGNLTRVLYDVLDKHTFVYLAIGELDPATHTFRLVNGGCPYPYHFRAATGEVGELRLDAYPLGVRPHTTYASLEVRLESGDRVVFCSDGLIEARDPAGEMFGFERIAEAIRSGCAQDLAAEELLEWVFRTTAAHVGERPQEDDQTMIVLQVD